MLAELHQQLEFSEKIASIVNELAIDFSAVIDLQLADDS